MYELALFAGAGGGILGGKLLGWRTIGAIEFAAFPRGVLAQRQNDGALDPFPIWDDVRTFRADNDDTRDYIAWLRSIADDLVISGGFPCQDISSVAQKREGLRGKRSGLWFEFERIIGEIKPRFVFVENSPMLRKNGLAEVLKGLARYGYASAWDIFSARECGAPHERKRMWLVATNTAQFKRHKQSTLSKRISFKMPMGGERKLNDLLGTCKLWPAGVRGTTVLGNGLAEWMDEVKAIGNGQVPSVAARAFSELSARLMMSA